MKNAAQHKTLTKLLDSHLVIVWDQGDKWQDALVSHLPQDTMDGVAIDLVRSLKGRVSVCDQRDIEELCARAVGLPLSR